MAALAALSSCMIAIMESFNIIVGVFPTSTRSACPAAPANRLFSPLLPLLIFAFMPIKSEIYQGKLHRAVTGARGAGEADEISN